MVEFAAEEIPFHPQLSHDFTVVGFFSTDSPWDSPGLGGVCLEPWWPCATGR